MIFKQSDSEDYRYDAFISHSHKDKSSVRWLCSVLRNYWIPYFNSRRRLFVDHASLNAGELGEHILNAIKSSKYLVVCNSTGAANSKWVNLEVEAFKKYRGEKYILAVRVGELEDDYLVKGISPNAFIPDLRGITNNPKKTDAKRYLENALSVLAPIVGYEDKTNLTDTIRRRKQFITLLLFIFLFTLGVGYLGWKKWLNTTHGLRYMTMEEVLISAEVETLDTPYIIKAVPAFAEYGLDKVVRFSQFYHTDVFKPLVLATGYANLPVPDCDSASQQLERLEEATLSVSPDIVLNIAKKCDRGLVGLLENTRKFDVNDVNWAVYLAEAGFETESSNLLKQLDGKKALDVIVALAITGHEVSYQQVKQTIQEWKGELRNNNESGLWEISSYLERLDEVNQLELPISLELIDIASNSFLMFDQDQISTVNSWEKIQQVAAQLAAIGQSKKAKDMLSLKNTPPSEFGANPQAEGWAWRGLALVRLGQLQKGLNAFENAEKDGLAELPQTRTWREWDTIVKVYALAGMWENAFLAARKPPDQLARLNLKLKVLELHHKME